MSAAAAVPAPSFPDPSHLSQRAAVGTPAQPAAPPGCNRPGARPSGPYERARDLAARFQRIVEHALRCEAACRRAATVAWWPKSLSPHEAMRRSQARMDHRLDRYRRALFLRREAVYVLEEMLVLGFKARDFLAGLEARRAAVMTTKPSAKRSEACGGVTDHARAAGAPGAIPGSPVGLPTCRCCHLNDYPIDPDTGRCDYCAGYYDALGENR